MIHTARLADSQTVPTAACFEAEEHCHIAIKVGHSKHKADLLTIVATRAVLGLPTSFCTVLFFQQKPGRALRPPSCYLSMVYVRNEVEMLTIVGAWAHKGQ